MTMKGDKPPGTAPPAAEEEPPTTADNAHDQQKYGEERVNETHEG